MLRLNERMESFLQELGWDIKYRPRSIILEKPERETSMTAKVEVTDSPDQPDSRFSIVATLYVPNEEGGRDEFLHRSVSLGRDKRANGWLTRIILEKFEAYLSRATNIERISDVHDRYKIK